MPLRGCYKFFEFLVNFCMFVWHPRRLMYNDVLHTDVCRGSNSSFSSVARKHKSGRHKLQNAINCKIYQKSLLYFSHLPTFHFISSYFTKKPSQQEAILPFLKQIMIQAKSLTRFCSNASLANRRAINQLVVSEILSL